MPPFSLFLCALLLLLSASARAAAVINNVPSGLLLTNPDGLIAQPNSSLPSNLTVPQPSDTLPHSPYVYPIPHHPSTVVVFFGFGAAVDELSAVECMLGATEDVQDALVRALESRDPNRTIPQRYIRIDAADAWLLIRPVYRQMSWRTCAQTLQAITRFLNTWEFVDLTFDVMEEGVRVGGGMLQGKS